MAAFLTPHDDITFVIVIGSYRHVGVVRGIRSRGSINRDRTGRLQCDHQRGPEHGGDPERAVFASSGWLMGQMRGHELRGFGDFGQHSDSNLTSVATPPDGSRINERFRTKSIRERHRLGEHETLVDAT
jgi:hypothetical protein